MNNIDDQKAAVIAAETISHRNTENPSNGYFGDFRYYNAFQTLFSKFEPNGDDPFYKELKESGIGHNEICKILLCNYVYIMIVTNWNGDEYTKQYYSKIRQETINYFMASVTEIEFDKSNDYLEKDTLFPSEMVSKFKISDDVEIKKATFIVHNLHNNDWY